MMQGEHGCFLGVIVARGVSEIFARRQQRTQLSSPGLPPSLKLRRAREIACPVEALAQTGPDDPVFQRPRLWNRGAAAYWMPRSSRGMTARGVAESPAARIQPYAHLLLPPRAISLHPAPREPAGQ